MKFPQSFRVLIFSSFFIFVLNNLQSQDYKNGDFQPVIASPAPNITFPQFKGGKKGLDQYLKDNVAVDDSLVSISKEGIIVISYRINAKNQIIEVSVDKLNTTMNEAFHLPILRVLKKASPWRSGLKNGKPFITRLQISFQFPSN